MAPAVWHPENVEGAVLEAFVVAKVRPLATQLNYSLERSPGPPSAPGWRIIDNETGTAVEGLNFDLTIKGVAAKIFYEADERRCDAVAEEARQIYETLGGGWFIGSDDDAPTLRPAPR